MKKPRGVPETVPAILRCFIRIRSLCLAESCQNPRRATVWLSSAAFFILLFGFAGCSQLSPADLVIINGPEPESLDPAIITGQADGRVVVSMFEGLTRYNAETGNAEPGLATRWDISSDGRTYIFQLRTNAAWSTGEPITAEDLVYSWRRILDPITASEYSGLLFYLKNGEAFATNGITDPALVGVKALNPHTVQVDLVDPIPFFVEICAYPTLAIVPRQTIAKHGDHWLMASPLPASGAYQLEFWKLNDRIRLRKNPRYWDAANTQLERIDLLPCVSAATALNLYETRQVDIVWDKELVPNELMDALRKRSDFHNFDYLGTYFIRYNVTRKPFHDARVRQALALAINKEKLVAKILKAGEKAAHQYVPPVIPNYQSPPGLGYDPERARRLLAEAGYPGGQNFPLFTYLYNLGKVHEQIGVELQEMWRRELGIRVELRNLEWKTYFRAQYMLDYDLCRSSWIGDYNDANTFLDVFMSNNGNNRTGWKSRRYDALLRQANAQFDVQKRAGLMQEAEGLLIRDEATIVPIYIYAGMEYYDPKRIKGVYSNMRSEHPLRTIRKVREEN
jgi:oligopeptide transport system substrate-binding protein